MHDRDLRDIKIFGGLAVLCGTILMLLTVLVALLILSTGGPDRNADLLKGGIALVAGLIMGAALVGTGGELQRAGRMSGPSRRSLRLDWTALLLVMLGGFAVGIWAAQALAIVASLIIIGLFLIRDAIINITSR
jgi:hypothetical protein